MVNTGYLCGRRKGIMVENKEKKIKTLNTSLGEKSVDTLIVDLCLISHFLETERSIHDAILYDKEELDKGIIAIKHEVKLGENVRADFKAETKNEILIIEVKHGIGDIDALNQLIQQAWAFNIRKKEKDENKEIVPTLIARGFTKEVIDFAKKQHITLKKYNVNLTYEDVV